MTWELAGTRAAENWSDIHAFITGENALDELQRWTIELYEEGPPTAQEERSIRARIDAYLLQPRDVAYFGSGILELLPEGLRDAAATHSLMHGLAMPSTEYGTLKTWVMSWKIAQYHAPQVRALPLAEREQDFDHFLQQPYFIESFRLFWRVAPKRRNNQRTRVLVSIGAALSQMVRIDEAADFDLWAERLTASCHFSSQTKDDLRSMLDKMCGSTYDMEELAYRLFVDAREIDQQNLHGFIRRYRDELSALAPELAHKMQFGSVCDE